MVITNEHYIEAINTKDAWQICDFVTTNETRLKQYFPKTLAQNLTPTLAKQFTEKKVKQYKNKEEFLFTVKSNKLKKIIGLVYLKELNWDTKQGEFAYCIDYNFQEKGITSKAIKIVIQYAFKNLKIKTLQIIVHKTNIGSIKVAEKNNFKWIKTLKNEFTPIGEQPLDMELYELYSEK